MQIDYSAAEAFFSYVDGDVPLTDFWEHPAYAIARTHANLLGMDLSREDVVKALANERTTFSTDEKPTENRKRISQLIEHVRANEAEWSEQIVRQLTRITPDENTSDLRLFLAIGYELGIGLQDGAYTNLNESLFLQNPRQLLYVAIHESSHVLYDRVHSFSSELGPKQLESREGQRTTFDTLFHTEAYATYTPLKLRRSEESAGERGHPICEDYRALTDDTRLRTLIEEYDSFRETLQEGPVPLKTLWMKVFGESRLPYRVGCALLKGIEEEQGLEEVRDAFYVSPEEFIEKYDWVLDKYRDGP